MHITVLEVLNAFLHTVEEVVSLERISDLFTRHVVNLTCLRCGLWLALKELSSK